MARTKKSARRAKNPAPWIESGNRGNYELPQRGSAQFVKYYQAQKFVPEGEWDKFYETLHVDLPVNFRITGTRSQAKELLKIIKSQCFNTLLNVQSGSDEVPLQLPKCLPWYPDELAWQIDTTRKNIRSSDHLKRLHEFLVAETESGNISRQEAVSMIPPLLMDIKPHHKILDLCAAPGSKTAQLIEYLHADESQPVPEGFVVANDVDNKRCYLMVHQVKRLQSPNCMIVNHDASTLPKLRSTPENCKPEFHFFDRVLADVPCSGDGTMRKNPDVWHKWKPINGHNLHGLQVKILKRGLELLRDGGRLVYSTCSFNPVEDEAVVAEMLRKCQGAVELVDVSKDLPGLQFVPGLSTWKCMSRFGDWFDDFHSLPANLQSQFRPSMFPPLPEELKTFHLERCIRILPHHQNTGGFFICVFHKVKHLPWMKCTAKEENAPQTETKEAVDVAEGSSPVTGDNVGQVPVSNNTTKMTADGLTAGDASEVKSQLGKRKAELGEDDSSPARKKNKNPKMKGYKEDPFLFLDSDDPIWPPIREFYKMPDDFPMEQLLYRSQQGNKRTLYFVSSSVKNVVSNNSNRIRFINLGVKLLSRSSSPLVPQCDFRIAQESMGILNSAFPGRYVSIKKSDAIMMLSEENPYVCKLTDTAQEQLQNMDPGSAVFHFKPSESEPEPNCSIVFCGWRGKVSVRSFVQKHDRLHYLLLFGLALQDIRARVQEEKAKKALTSKASEDAEGLKKVTESEKEAVEDEGTLDEMEREPKSKDEGGSEKDAKSLGKVEGTGKDVAAEGTEAMECDETVKETKFEEDESSEKYAESSEVTKKDMAAEETKVRESNETETETKFKKEEGS